MSHKGVKSFMKLGYLMIIIMWVALINKKVVIPAFLVS